MKVRTRTRSLAVLAASASVYGVTMFAAAPSAIAGCQWVVTWSSAGVYADPYTTYGLLKNKYQGEIVGPYCSDSKYWNGTYWMTPVSCACDHNDGVGWMRSAALNPA